MRHFIRENCNSVTARLSLLFSYDKDKQIFYYSLMCINTICSKSVLSSQHGCHTKAQLSVYINPSPGQVFTKSLTVWGCSTGADPITASVESGTQIQKKWKI